MRRLRGRSVAALVAIVALSMAGSADAKKKKHPKVHKTHKTPASKSGGKAEPAESAEPEEEKTTSPRESGGVENKPAPAPEENAPEGEAPRKSPRPRHGEAAEEPAAEGEFGLPALDLVVGAGAMFRTLDWNQDVTSSFAPYKLSPGPELRLGMEVFPGAFFTSGFAANVGLFGGFNRGVAVTSKVQSTGMKLTTSFQDFLVGVKVRLPFGNLAPYASAAYGGQSFRLGGQDPFTVPGVDYKFLRFGLGARFRITAAIDLGLGGAAFNAVTDVGKTSGDVGSPALLPQASAYAVDLGVSMGVRLAGPFGVRFGGDFRQYGITGNSHATDPVRVGGATDRYVVGWGGLELVFDGVTGQAEATSVEEAKPAAKKGPRRRQAEPELEDQDAGKDSDDQDGE